MKKNYIVFYIFFVVFGMIGGALLISNSKMARAVGQVLRSGSNNSLMQTSSSTTTPNFLQTGTGTTTLTFPSQEFDRMSVFIQEFASTTNGDVKTTPTFYIERQASDNGIDFFTYDDSTVNPASVFSATTTRALASTTLQLSYSPALWGTTTKAVDLKLLPANWTRLIFSVGTTTNMATSYRDTVNLYANVVGSIKANQ